MVFCFVFFFFLTSSCCTFKDVFPAPNSQSEVCDAGQEPAGALSTQGKGELHSLTGTHERPGRFLAQNLHCSPFPSWRSSVGWGGTHRDGNEHPEALGTRGLPQSQRCYSAQAAGRVKCQLTSCPCQIPQSPHSIPPLSTADTLRGTVTNSCSSYTEKI